jgi:glucuronoarabinoxylan endo-1,4-beta-xylanase
MMFQNIARKAGLLAVIVLVLFIFEYSVFIPRQKTYAASAVVVNGATTYQQMDGFGFSDAFGPALTLENLPSSSEQKSILNLLFSPTTGAGFTILRNLLPSDAANTIEPTSPGSPTGTPTYVPLGSSEGQVWLAQQAQSYGVKQFYGDAWSSPGFMKTNGDESNGGTLCGSPGAATCSTGDWRQAYANYLVQYAKDYASAGVPLTQLGAFNEPNLTTTYSSMSMNPTQTADLIAVLGPTLHAAGLSSVPEIACCDGEGWDTAQSYASGITNNTTANADESIISSHGYTGAPNFALTGTGSKHIWETEWATWEAWDTAWDDGSDASGFSWAQNVYNGITEANLSAFLYWWGVSFGGTDNGFLINDVNGTVTPSARLWALANYSRYIHPGATRIGATSGDSNLEVTAYQNTDGTLSLVVLNQAYNAVPATFALQNVTLPTSAVATPYATDATDTATAQTALPIQNGAFSATIGARQMVTYQIATGTAPTPTPTSTATATATSTPGTSCAIGYTLNSQWPGGFSAAISIKNTASTAISSWTLQFSFPGSQEITDGWDGNFTQSGNTVTITNASWNGSISPGGSLGSQPGFNGSWSGSNPSPTAFTLNGVACSVS